MDVVDGTKQEPGTSDTAEVKQEFERQNSRALLLIAANVEPNQMAYIMPHRLGKGRVGRAPPRVPRGQPCLPILLAEQVGKPATGGRRDGPRLWQEDAGVDPRTRRGADSSLNTGGHPQYVERRTTKVQTGGRNSAILWPTTHHRHGGGQLEGSRSTGRG